MTTQTSFDPYLHWLGIPPQEQPPNYYRLLGLQAYEQNMQTILSAADQRLTYLASMMHSEYASYAQQLYNEISYVRSYLSDQQTKQQYDAWLYQVTSGYQPQQDSQNQGYQQSQNYQAPPVHQQPQTPSQPADPYAQAQPYQSSSHQPPMQDLGDASNQTPQAPQTAGPANTPAAGYPAAEQPQQPSDGTQPEQNPAEPSAKFVAGDSGPKLMPPKKRGSQAAENASPAQSAESAPPSPAAPSASYTPMNQPSYPSPPQPSAPTSPPQASAPQSPAYGTPASPYQASAPIPHSPGQGATENHYAHSPYGNQGTPANTPGVPQAPPAAGIPQATPGIPQASPYGTPSGGYGTDPVPLPNVPQNPGGYPQATAQPQGPSFGMDSPSSFSSTSSMSMRRRKSISPAVGGIIAVVGLIGILGVILGMSTEDGKNDPVAKNNEPKKLGPNDPIGQDNPPPTQPPGGQDQEPGPSKLTLPPDPQPPQPEPMDDPTPAEPAPITPTPTPTEPPGMENPPNTGNPPSEDPTTDNPNPGDNPPATDDPDSSMINPLEIELPPTLDAPTESSPQQAEDLTKALQQVRLAMEERNMDAASESLKTAQEQAVTAEQQAEVARYKLAVENLKKFWEGVASQMDAMSAGEEIMVKGRIVVVVEATADKLILRDGGRNRRFALNVLPTSLVMHIAGRYFDSSPGSQLLIATFHAIDPEGDQLQARQKLDLVAAAGAKKDAEAIRSFLE